MSGDEEQCIQKNVIQSVLLSLLLLSFNPPGSSGIPLSGGDGKRDGHAQTQPRCLEAGLVLVAAGEEALKKSQFICGIVFFSLVCNNSNQDKHL